MLARAHVANRAWLLAVAGQARGGQLVEGHPFGAGRDQRLCCAGPAVHALDRPDVEVFAGVGARHDRDLGRFQIEHVHAARLDQGDDAERLDAAPEGDQAVGIAEPAEEPSVDVDLDDVAAVDALFDAVSNLADEDRRDNSGAGSRPPGDRTRCAGAASGSGPRGGKIGSGHDPAENTAAGRIPAT